MLNRDIRKIWINTLISAALLFSMSFLSVDAMHNVPEHDSKKVTKKPMKKKIGKVGKHKNLNKKGKKNARSSRKRIKKGSKGPGSIHKSMPGKKAKGSIKRHTVKTHSLHSKALPNKNTKDKNVNNKKLEMHKDTMQIKHFEKTPEEKMLKKNSFSRVEKKGISGSRDFIDKMKKKKSKNNENNKEIKQKGKIIKEEGKIIEPAIIENATKDYVGGTEA